MIPTPEQRETVRIRIAKERLINALKSEHITPAQVDAMMAACELAKEKAE